MEENINLGKYAISIRMDDIYFNDKYPNNQTLKKERRNDKFVEVYLDGKWEKRLIEDVFKPVNHNIERYHNMYFKGLQDTYDDIDKNKSFRQLIYPIRSYGHQMLWYG